uniref:RNA exonuclease 5 n=1 Tax=Neolamprologus brichardi TaxID=32507 RepID=A0A3Q4MFL7_NEOBR
MESSTVAKCKAKKRKNSTHTAQEEAKRFKTEQRDDEVLQCGPASCLPRVSVLPDCLQQPIGLNELTELLQYAALGKTGGIKKPSWCQRVLSNSYCVNVVIVEDLTQNHFYKHYLCLQHLRTSYTSVRGKINTNHPIITMFGTERRGLTAYVLTEEEMIKNNYPVKGMPGFEEFVCTNCADCVTDSSPLFGIDCEMCVTKDGKELTRVSLVDGDGKCLMDELVKPPNHILNYLSYVTSYRNIFIVLFSGITPVMLQPVTTTLQDVQGMLIRILPHEAVLVGHSLEHDLIVLKSFRNLKTQPFFSVLQFSTLSNHLKSYFPRQERHHQMVRLFASALIHSEDIRLRVFTLSIYSLQTCSRLQDMCVVFAGPFPTGFSDGDVKQLFSFCGAVRKVKMLNTVVRVCIAFIVSPICYKTRAAKFFTVA